jgi:hypothetical protein
VNREAAAISDQPAAGLREASRRAFLRNAARSRSATNVRLPTLVTGERPRLGQAEKRWLGDAAEFFTGLAIVEQAINFLGHVSPRMNSE